MPTKAQFAVPAADIALADTFDRLPGARVTIEQSVARCGGEAHYLWVSTPEKRDVQQVLAGDPSVKQFDQLAADDRRWLFEIEFSPAVRLLRSILLCEGGVITDFTGSDGQWVITCRYTDHASLGAVSDLLDQRGFQYDVLRVHDASGTTSADATLTDEQYTALEHACREGYFEVPRAATLEELASDLDISHQALSERIRRGVSASLESEFPTEDGQPPEMKPPAPEASLQ